MVAPGRNSKPNSIHQLFGAVVSATRQWAGWFTPIRRRRTAGRSSDVYSTSITDSRTRCDLTFEKTRWRGVAAGRADAVASCTFFSPTPISRRPTRCLGASHTIAR